jgi:hypothetical protein
MGGVVCCVTFDVFVNFCDGVALRVASDEDGRDHVANLGVCLYADG